MVISWATTLVVLILWIAVYNFDEMRRFIREAKQPVCQAHWKAGLRIDMSNTKLMSVAKVGVELV